jgi:hypothetical protein
MRAHARIPIGIFKFIKLGRSTRWRVHMRHKHLLDGIIIWLGMKRRSIRLRGSVHHSILQVWLSPEVSTSSSGCAFFSSIVESLASNKVNRALSSLRFLSSKAWTSMAVKTLPSSSSVGETILLSRWLSL